MQAVLVNSLMTIDIKSLDQSVAQQLTITHELIAPSLKSPIASSEITVVKSPMT